MARDFSRPWYHGSNQRLETLRVGSSITQNQALARAFSHRPKLLVQEGEADVGGGTLIKHNGTDPGYLYIVDEPLTLDDIEPHPHPSNVGHWEWLSKKEVRVTILEKTNIRPGDLLTEQEVTQLRQKQQERGETSFANFEPT